MALSSQKYRPTFSHSASAGRGIPLWQLLTPAVVAAFLVVYVLFLRPSPGQATATPTAATGTPSTPTANAASGAHATSNSVAPAGAPGRAPAAPSPASPTPAPSPAQPLKPGSQPVLAQAAAQGPLFSQGAPAAKKSLEELAREIQAAHPKAAAAAGPSQTTGEAASMLAQGQRALQEGRHIEARSLLSRVLTDLSPSVSDKDAQSVRQQLASVNETLIFSPFVAKDDPLVAEQVVDRGDSYARIAPKHQVTAWLLEKINGVPSTKLQVGKIIKVVRGPFHAVVDKSGFRMDLFLPGPDGKLLYVKSLPVGLGEGDSTPAGAWVVKSGSKTPNPAWKNPRTGQFFAPNNPDNPIGEFWLGLQGTDANTEKALSIGIHGTNDPASVGQMKSMGCVRMLAADVELAYNLLLEKVSTVRIQP